MAISILGYTSLSGRFYQDGLIAPEGRATYRKTGELAEGEFGCVFTVTSSHDPSKTWVLKIPKQKGITASIKEARIIEFLNEKERLEGKDHVIKMVASFIIGPTEDTEQRSMLLLFPHYSSDLFELTKEDPLSIKDTQKVALQLLNTASFLEKHKVLHRDFKPENIVADENLNIKLIDFGLAVQLDTDDEMREVVGTPEYIPPEAISWQVLAKESPIAPYGFSSECFSLGATIFNIANSSLLIQPPKEKNLNDFYGNLLSQHNHLARNLKWRIFDITNINTSPLLKSLLNGLLEADPKKRMSIDTALKLFDPPQKRRAV